MAKLEDMIGDRRAIMSAADWVTSDITLTTDADQTPIAPGNRVSDVTKDGRRTAHFVSGAPILNFFSIQSARLPGGARASTTASSCRSIITRATTGTCPRCSNAMGTALDYYRANFGPYQFNYARIIEFPGYASFAQAFAGTMPYSESIGFNANTDDPDKIDFTTYVVAHEMAHQYWAHQVIGADMQGGTMTSETLAQYSALMVMKHLYGPDKIRRFLKYELDNYLQQPAGRSGRGSAARAGREPGLHPLPQGRGGRCTCCRSGWARRRSTARWRGSTRRFRFKGAPYLRSVDLIDEFRKEAKTPEQQQLITDLFEKITLYDLKVQRRVDAQGWRRLDDDADGRRRQILCQRQGRRRPRRKLAEPIEVGLFTARPGLGAFSAKDVIVMGREPIRSGVQRITLHSKAKPPFAGVDPYNFYVDRNSDDNVKDVTAS